MSYKKKSHVFLKLLPLVVLSLIFGLHYCSFSLAEESIKLYSQNKLYSASVVEKGKAECCPGEKELLVRILNKQSKQEKNIMLTGRFASVDEVMFNQHSKLLAIGELPRGGNIISISNLEKEDMQDTIWNYGYAFSPSKRFIIYITHYPKMIVPEFRRSIVLIYDTAKSISENRHSSTLSYTRKNAGLPIFPETNLRNKSYDVTLEDEHIYTSPFLWSVDGKKILFFEFYNLENYMILIDLNKGISAAKILRKHINIDELARKEKMLEATKKELFAKPYKLTIKDIRWSGPKEVIIQPYPQYWLGQKIKLSIPQ